ncbi:type II secretion system secretin GspD [Pendulispora rubella]|uniref:Type II secretion system secretin GspD n=1 Tax=Pendulispora rubella TaxID=2741070 RepID=A0ABZ2L7W4_9BACT
MQKQIHVISLTLATLVLGWERDARAQTPSPPSPPPVTAVGKGSGEAKPPPPFEKGMEFEPRHPGDRVTFALEDADLSELVRVVGQLTGKKFIFGDKVRKIKASVYSPTKVTVEEAYQAFLSILETNGLTVIPQGQFLKIVETAGVASQSTPTIGPQEGAPHEDRYVTRMHRLRNANPEEVANLLTKFKSKDADVSWHGPGNLLIITDTGANIRRLMTIVDEIDVPSAGDKIWLEPIHYATASEMAQRLTDLFDIKSTSASSAPGGKGAPLGVAPSGDLHVAKIVADERTNTIVIVATEKAYLRTLELVKKLDVPQTADGQVHVFSLQNADAIELAKTLTEMVAGSSGAAGGASSSGSGTQPSTPRAPVSIFESALKVSADKATNSIIVTSSSRDYAALRAVVDKLDVPRRSVFIEAAILDLNVSQTNTFGVNFHSGDALGGAGGLLFGGLNPGKSVTPSPEELQGLALGLRGPTIPGSESLFGAGVSIPSFGMTIQALAHNENSDVLSTPHILATDNQKALINIGANIPLQVNPGFSGLGALPGAIPGSPQAAALGSLGGLGALGGGGGARSEVGTKLSITPHVNDSNQVRLEIVEEISAGGDQMGGLGVIPITKRNAETTVVVRDQQTVVIGGLMRTEKTLKEDKIPLLGDIPLVGALFRKTVDVVKKTNLILVLTPYIIRDQDDLRAIYERKLQERQQFLDHHFIFDEKSDYQAPKDYSRTNGLVEFIRQSHLQVAEQKKRDALLEPKKLLTHEPGAPLEVPEPAHAPSANPPAQRIVPHVEP